MLKYSGGGPWPIRLCVDKKLKILMNFNRAGPVSKNGPKF